MISFFQITSIVLLLIIFLVVIRLVKGPTVLDRVVAVNMIGTKTTILLVLIGVVFERVGMFVDIAIAYGLLNFIASIAVAKYFQHNKVMSPESQWKGKIEKQ